MTIKNYFERRLNFPLFQNELAQVGWYVGRQWRLGNDEMPPKVEQSEKIGSKMVELQVFTYPVEFLDNLIEPMFRRAYRYRKRYLIEKRGTPEAVKPHFWLIDKPTFIEWANQAEDDEQMISFYLAAIQRQIMSIPQVKEKKRVVRKLRKRKRKKV